MNEHKRKKQAYRISEFCEDFGIGRTTVHEQILAGRLKTFKVGRATLISVEAAAAWLSLCESESKMAGGKCRS